MNKPAAFFVITRYNEKYSWVKEYTDNYIIYNKGKPIYNNKKIINTENWGYNERDIAKYIYENYENLPELIAFLQGDPFAQCPKDHFDKLIYNEHFTRIEPIYFDKPDRNPITGLYFEGNPGNRFGPDTYGSVDNFMNAYFSDYTYLSHLEFSPGAQYIIEKAQALKYPQIFWYKIMNDKMNTPTAIQSHIFERAIYYIFTGNYTLREEIYDRE